jgi:hypothetical protein
MRTDFRWKSVCGEAGHLALLPMHLNSTRITYLILKWRSFQIHRTSRESSRHAKAKSYTQVVKMWSLLRGMIEIYSNCNCDNWLGNFSGYPRKNLHGLGELIIAYV